MSDDDHRRIVETNLLGPILLTRRVVAQLRADAAPGDIVFISSDATVNKRPHLATYLSTKAGLEAFAQTLALECEGVGDPLVGRAGRTDAHRLRRRLGPQRSSTSSCRAGSASGSSATSTRCSPRTSPARW